VFIFSFFLSLSFSCSDFVKIWALPTEDPPGSEDVYRQDTSLIVTSAEGKVWGNYAPEGCVHGVSTGEPSDQQIEVFKSLVALVKDIANKAAPAPAH